MKFRKRRKRRDPLQEELLNTCSWCGIRIPEGTEVFSLSATLRPGVDLKSNEGTVLPMKLEAADKLVLAIVPTADSAAKKEGKDILFMICSDDCGDALGKALEQEVNPVNDPQSI
jgi:hypothetical protein